MLTSLITLPVRLGLRGAELGLRAGRAVAERAIDLAGEVLAPPARERRRDHQPSPASGRAREDDSRASASSPADDDESRSPDPRSAAPSPEQTVTEQEAAAGERPAPAGPEPPPPPPPAPSPPAGTGSPEPVQVDEELVREVADPGAEEGAGAQIHIAEPWQGYAELKAADVVDQLAGRDQAELAAVELYEASHRNRQTVIDAAKRELRRADDAG